ncbi:MAG: DUF4019 domain-containing protein [Candidatus Accumulibacter sp. UW25]|jgi:hypothetical protein
MKVAASVSLVICAAALASAPAKGQEAEAVSQAKAAATSWLALVDAGNYAASWQQTAGLFQSAISEQSWVSAVQATRASLGALQSRQVASATYTRTLPGAPPGEYVVIKYTSKFAGRASAVETVTPMKEKNDSWRVLGYYVQ